MTRKKRAAPIHFQVTDDRLTILRLPDRRRAAGIMLMALLWNGILWLGVASELQRPDAAALRGNALLIGAFLVAGLLLLGYGVASWVNVVRLDFQDGLLTVRSAPIRWEERTMSLKPITGVELRQEEDVYSLYLLPTRWNSRALLDGLTDSALASELQPQIEMFLFREGAGQAGG